MRHVAPWSIWSAVLTVSLICCSIARGQSLDFEVDGPTEVAEGDYVELTVLFPEGVKADVDFTPIEESDFGVHPVVSETLVKGKLTATVVGRKCTFSARCMGERDLVVVATAFANFDGVPRLKSLKHKIRVTAKQAPNPPPAPPKEPPADPPPAPKPNPPADPDDDLGPWVPLPGESNARQANPASDDIEKITKILGNMMDRIESLEKRSTQVAVSAPVVVKETVAPAPVVVKPAPVASPVIVDVKPGHWSVGSARNEWSPTKAETIAHLRQSHSSAELRKYEPLESLSHEALRTLHDDAHEGRISAARTVVSSPVSVYTQPAVMRSGGCPGGVCPTPSRSYSTGRGIFGFRR